MTTRTRNQARVAIAGMVCTEFGSTWRRHSNTILCYTAAFWFEHRLWGDAVLGYHLIEHRCCTPRRHFWWRSCCVAWPSRARFLAAAIFALHPVHVESVAWITEQKNTLSAVFYLGRALSYIGSTNALAVGCTLAPSGCSCWAC